MKDSLQQQIHFNGNIFGNTCCCCNEGLLYISERPFRARIWFFRNLRAHKIAIYQIVKVSQNCKKKLNKLSCNVSKHLLTCAPNEDSNQTAHPRCLISLRCLHDETLHPLLSKIRPVTILIWLQADLNLRRAHMSEGQGAHVGNLFETWVVRATEG